MAERLWTGGVGDWNDAGRWSAAGSGAAGRPKPGDGAAIAGGDVEIVGSQGLNGTTYDGVALILGDTGEDPTRLDLSQAFLGHYVATDLAGSAAIAARGTSAIAGTLTEDAAGSRLTLGSASLLNGDAVSPAAFKMLLSATGGQGTGAGGFFDDPHAGEGSCNERGVQLVPGVNSVEATYYANSAAFGGSPSYDDYFTDSGPGEIVDDPSGRRYPSRRTAGKLDFDAPDGVPVPEPASSDPNVSTPFYGTSAAAPNAAAVAALMRQANPDLSTDQVTALLQGSAIDQGLATKQQGAGLIQADKAVAGAIAAGQASAAEASAVSHVPLFTLSGDGIFNLMGPATGRQGAAGVAWTDLAHDRGDPMFHG